MEASELTWALNHSSEVAQALLISMRQPKTKQIKVDYESESYEFVPIKLGNVTILSGRPF